MNREEIAAFLASMKKLRDGLDNFNSQVAALDGAGRRLGLLCEETAAACPAGAAAMAQSLSGLAQSLHLFGGTVADVLPSFLDAAGGVARGMRLLEMESRKGAH